MPCCSNPITTEGLTYESKDMVSLQKSPIDWNGGLVGSGGGERLLSGCK